MMKKVASGTSSIRAEKVNPSPRLPRAELVYAAVKEAILSGQLHSGSRILETDIARMLGVSRTPVREALNHLSARGLIEEAPGRGFVVTRLDRQHILELYALREVLEATAARLASQHASIIEIEHLCDLHKEFATSEGNSGRLRDINRRFHQTISDASHNRYLVQWLKAFQDTLALLPYTAYEGDRYRSAQQEHASILGAINAHEAEEAERAARMHVRNGLTHRLKILFHTEAV